MFADGDGGARRDGVEGPVANCSVMLPSASFILLLLAIGGDAGGVADGVDGAVNDNGGGAVADAVGGGSKMSVLEIFSFSLIDL